MDIREIRATDWAQVWPIVRDIVETAETFAVETYTNYSSSDYNGFRPNEGADFSFE